MTEVLCLPSTFKWKCGSSASLTNIDEVEDFDKPAAIELKDMEDVELNSYAKTCEDYSLKCHSQSMKYSIINMVFTAVSLISTCVAFITPPLIPVNVSISFIALSAVIQFAIAKFQWGQLSETYATYSLEFHHLGLTVPNSKAFNMVCKKASNAVTQLELWDYEYDQTQCCCK
jgi:hypothetical protein